MTRVVVSGAIANKYRNGGAIWTRLSWALAFRQLGMDVFFIEQLDPAAAVDEAGQRVAFSDCAPARRFDRVMRDFQLAQSSALLLGDGEQILGASRNDLGDVAAEADVLINITGHLETEWLFRRFRKRVYVDLDPGYTQFWHQAGVDGARLAGHHLFFTVGQNIGTPRCSIPTSGIEWRPTRQPVLLDEWPVSTVAASDRFTTIASWRGPYGVVNRGGATLGPKAHEFRKLLDVPRLCPEQTFEIALDIHGADRADREALVDHGWQLVDPAVVAGDPAAFRRYVQGSAAEFSAAQSIYVQTGSGWLGDRTVRYLASGKPAVVQDTGIGANYPTGEGLLTFRTNQEAAACVRDVASDYARHCRAARRLAEQYFDARLVAADLLQACADDRPLRALDPHRRSSVGAEALLQDQRDAIRS